MLAGRKAAPWALLAPLVFLFALFLVYPLQGILRESFSGTSSLDPLFEDTYYLERAWFSAWQAAVSAGLTLLLAIPLAWVLACHDFPGKRAIESLVIVPFVLPTLVVAVAFTALLGPSGTANDLLTALPGIEEPPIRLLNTIWAILLAHVFYNVAVAARIIGSAWRGLDPRIEEAAIMLGASRTRQFLVVTLPLLRNSILAAGSLVFLYCFTSFGVVLILGGPGFGTLETEIYRETLFLFRLPVAATLAIVQAIATFGVMLVNARLQRGIAQGSGQRRPSPWTRGNIAGVAVVVAVVVALTVVPIAALAERSFRPGAGYGFDYYRLLDDNVRGQALFVAPLTAVRNSVVFALATAAISVPVGAAAAMGANKLRSSLLEALIQLPIGISSVTLGLGFLITLGERPLDLRQSPALVVVAHSLIAIPFVARVVGSRLRNMDPRLPEAAATLGAGPLRSFFRVQLPLLRGAVLVGTVIAFATSMGEFGATLLIARPDYPTIPIAIFRVLGQPGAQNFGQALALSTILMAVTAGAFFLIDLFRGRETEGF